MIFILLILIGLLAPHAAAFERALPGYAFAFPRDHFEHPGFEIEWWYYTGNVRTAEGRRFGYELTFFRLAVERSEPPKTAWDVDQLYLAHFALSDIEAGRFYRSERLNRAGPGLAGASQRQAAIWNGNWSSRWDAAGGQSLFAVAGGVGIDFELRPLKAAVVHGLDGVSRKSQGPGRASHYISFTRLATAGRIRVGGEDYAVEGLSWMDHEFSSDSMGPEAQGWDWMSIQLNDGTELMLYGMRGEDGAHNAFSSGTFVDAQGNAVHLEAADFSLEPGRAWQSPDSGARYPLEWTIRVRKPALELRCTPAMDAQEMVARGSAAPTYWEGAVRYEGTKGGEEVSGSGYLEMTGYDRKIRLGSGD